MCRQRSGGCLTTSNNCIFSIIKFVIINKKLILFNEIRSVLVNIYVIFVPVLDWYISTIFAGVKRLKNPVTLSGVGDSERNCNTYKNIIY